MQSESISAPPLTTLPAVVTARTQQPDGVLIHVAMTTGVIVAGAMVLLLLAQGLMRGYAFIFDALGWQ